MYGLVNIAIRDLILTRHGEDTWNRIVARSGASHGTFVGMERYPDSLTYDLVGAASEILETPVPALLEAFGEFWMTFTAEKGYGDALEFAGDTFREFLTNLDDMHARVSLSFPELEPPSFDVEDLGDGRLELHYHSDRPGLAPMVVGLLRGLARRFEERIEIEHLAPIETAADAAADKGMQDSEAPAETSAVHDRFLVRLVGEESAAA